MKKIYGVRVNSREAEASEIVIEKETEKMIKLPIEQSVQVFNCRTSIRKDELNSIYIDKGFKYTRFYWSLEPFDVEEKIEYLKQDMLNEIDDKIAYLNATAKEIKSVKL